MLDFIKYHGLGNDFILLKGGLSGRAEPRNAKVKALCARSTGIGADGLMLAHPSTCADLKMTLINSDGTKPEMCGNGLRCLVKHAVDDLGLRAQPLMVETGAGVLACNWALGEGGKVERVEVAMGAPSFDRAEIPMLGQGSSLELPIELDGRTWTASGVGTGNPHMVIFGEASLTIASTWGPRLTHHPMWPRGANVEFVERLSETHLRVRVWERGCGLTQACGTGATAAAAAAVRLELAPADTKIRVSLPGGDLFIRVAGDLQQAWMEGPAVEVYRGQLPIDALSIA